jgi:hypothetical protein
LGLKKNAEIKLTFDYVVDFIELVVDPRGAAHSGGKKIKTSSL